MNVFRIVVWNFILLCFFIRSSKSPTLQINPSVRFEEQLIRSKPIFFNTITPTFFEKQISAQDLDQSTTPMFTIAESGRYYLSNDVAITSGSGTATVYRVATDNVVLNLNSHFITQNGGPTNLTVIEIASGVSNVLIFNGYINSITGTGVSVSSNCSNIFFNSMHIDSCTLVGFTANSSNNLEFKGSLISNCDGSHASAADGALGAKFSSCNNVIIAESFFNNNRAANSTDGIGLFLTGCTNCVVFSSEASTNNGNLAYGFRIASTNACHFIDCIANANESNLGECFGYHIDSSNNNTFTNCCGASNTAASNSYGFRTSAASYNKFIDCQATNQTVASTGNAFGFGTTSSTGTKFFDCLSQGNTGGSTAGSNTSLRTTLGSLGVGFELGLNSVREVIELCKAIANDGGSGTGLGISIDNSTNSRHIVLNNELYGNTGTFARYGYRDFTPTQTTTFLAKNISSGQGLISPGISASPTLTSTMNYMWNATGVTHNSNALVVEPINLTRMEQIDRRFSFQNISTSET
jgi:hypothetical protein